MQTNTIDSLAAAKRQLQHSQTETKVKGSRRFFQGLASGRQVIYLSFALLIAVPDLAWSTDFDLRTDWSDSGLPMAGVWTIDFDGTPMIPVPDVAVTGADVWPGGQAGYTTVANDLVPIWFQARDDAVNYFTNPTDADWLLGDIVFHDADAAPTSASWTSPENGLADISISLWNPRNFGRVQHFELTLNSTVLGSGDVDDSSDRANRVSLSVNNVSISVGDIVAVTSTSVVIEDYMGLDFSIVTNATPVILDVRDVDTPGADSVLHVGGLFDGVSGFNDRGGRQRWINVPQRLVGADYIESAQNNADVSDDRPPGMDTLLIEVDVAEGAVLYMFIVERSLIGRQQPTPFPWMNFADFGADWVDTGLDIFSEVNRVFDDRPFNIWRTVCPLAAGTYNFRQMPIDSSFYGIAATFGTPATFLIIDEDSIDNGIQSIETISFGGPSCGSGYPDTCVNDDIADPGVRDKLFTRGLDIIDMTRFGPLTLPTGEVGDEGLFKFTNPDPQMSQDGGAPFTIQEFIFADGAAADENNLDKIDGVVPLCAVDIFALEGETVCAVVYDSDVSADVKDGYASLKGATTGLTAFKVTAVGPDPDGSVLPEITVELLSSVEVMSTCEQVVPPQ